MSSPGSQHVAKLRKARDNNGSGSTTATPTKATPKKRAAPGSGRKKSTAPAVKSPEEDDEDEAIPGLKNEYKEEEGLDELDFDTPTKRPKIEDP